MPGMHFIYTTAEDISQERCASSLNSFLHDDRYTSEIIHSDRSAFLGVTRYPGYPIAVFEDDRYFFLLEGRLYDCDRTSTHTELRALGDILFGQDYRADRAGDWIIGHDGDFVVAGFHKASGRWALVNDALGRLPLYYYRHHGTIYVSREIRFIGNHLSSPAMDRIAIAQYLLFGFPLDRRTLFAGVERLSPASVMCLGDHTDDFTPQTVHRFDFEAKQPSASAPEIAEPLVSLFINACDKIADADGSNVLSLSGGLDSRAVAAGLVKAGRGFRAVTFEDIYNKDSADVTYARDLAAALGIEWRSIQLSPPQGRDVRQLLLMTGGMNSTAMAFYIPFLKEIDRLWGSGITYITGDGGDKTLPDLRPARRISSPRRLAAFIIDRHDVLSLNRVARLVNLSASDIREELQRTIESYPERSPDYKYVHFMIYERAVKWLFEGEDRNRRFFRGCTPFYSLPFFRAAMTCPDDIKARHVLYREFMAYLSPHAVAIPDSNKGVPLTSPAYRRKEAIFSLLARYPGISRRLKNRLFPPGSYGPGSPVILCLRHLASQSQAVDYYIDISELKQMTKRPEQFSRSVFDNLLTVTGMIAQVSGETGFFDDFQDRAFI